MADTTASAKLASRNPATGEVLGEVEIATREGVEQAMRAAREAQVAWAALPVPSRLRILRAVKNGILDSLDGIADLLVAETGKPKLEAVCGEIFGTLESIDYYLRNARRILAPRRMRHRILRMTRSWREHVPWGVVGLITPWNYPFYLTVCPAVAALAAGNAVLAKPSEYTPLVGLRIEKIFREAGVPEGLYRALPGYGDVGATLVEALPDKVSFTGSVATGRKVAAACGERLIPVQLELGGKDPMIVLAGAPLERAANAAVWGAFTNSGQVCASVERVYVERGIAERFTEMVAGRVRVLRQGRGSDPDVDVGSMQNERQLATVKRQYEDAVAKGARVVARPEAPPPGGGLFFQPAVLAGVDDSMLLMTDEQFGPLLPIVPVAGADEAVARSNASPYGLTASVWTGDDGLGRELARRLEFGTVYVNDLLAPSGAGEAPWGGFKASGFGKSRGEEGLLEMVRTKHVAVDRFRTATLPFWYPYSREKVEVFSKLLPDLYADGLWRRLRGLLRARKLVSLFRRKE